ncbi:AAA family ATPase [Dysgonomonas sp. OttesenSCG-928-M03]|nr:AAA family ATPase [Dysgonomonas sp. OttesenSCG-928-M03]
MARQKSYRLNIINMIQKNNFYIITGGPGVGKTTLIEELEHRGYNCIPEVAREIIRYQMEIQGDALPWLDAKKYSKMMLSYSIRDFVDLSGSDKLYFFDRGIPDTYGYEKLMNFDTDHDLKVAVQKYRYNKTVFILPPWEKIYHTDNERQQDFSVAVDTYEVMKYSYKQLGYELCEVPLLAVEDRADFVIEKLNEK